ncbi:MAG: tRNA lysidine(34) synthetase TilS [Planctomycetota bacterium]
MGTLRATPTPRRRPVRWTPAAKRVIATWRALTGGEHTLVACSAGSDSGGLAIALAAGEPERVTMAHVVHDLRPREEACADRDAAAGLADRLGVPFRVSEVRVAPGNAEDQARRARYDALAAMGAELGIRFVATAHHADDQLETLVMALVRGAGLDGLSGMPGVRPLDERTTLVRPALGVRRTDLGELCTEFGWVPHHDATNDDTTRRRAALRARVLPALHDIAPAGAERAASSASLIGQAAEVVRRRAGAVFGDLREWSRAELQQELPIVLGEGVRRAALSLTAGEHADSLTSRALEPVLGAIADDSTEPRRFELAGGVRIMVAARTVSIDREWQDG